MARNTNKRKGSDAERRYAKLFRELGFTYCQTSRYGSRVHDDSGIDLINLPFNVQIKAGKQRGLNESEVLRSIKEKIPKYFPKQAPECKRPLFLIHHKDGKQGVPRTEFDTVVSMTIDDFLTLIRRIQWD